MFAIIIIVYGCSSSPNNSNVKVNFDVPDQGGLRVCSYIDLNDTINYPIKNNSSIINISQQQFLQIRYNENFYNFYASPGNTIDVKINPQGEIHFDGDLSEVNNTLVTLDKKVPFNIPLVQTSDPLEIIAIGDSTKKEMLSLIPNDLTKDETSFLKSLITKRVALDRYINYLFNKEVFNYLDSYPQDFDALQQEIVNEDEYVKQKHLPYHVTLEFYKNLSLYKKHIRLHLEIDSILNKDVLNPYNLELLESRILKDSITMNGNSLQVLKSISTFKNKYPKSVYKPSIMEVSK